ncbi:cytochrome p450 [Trichoderma arundinaceum]|uniref:sterol 22-desaturase n=1 Tax=Trichoderma arundinaceum TaxID=490622 RepID=A0A395NTL1_TRIAR|nr:cytochrome p450 [Trichoderma arundinaceum]
MATIVQGSMPVSVESITNATQHGVSEQTDGLLSMYRFASSWQIAVTAFLMLIAYDQLLYIKQKGSIVGPMFKIPLMGPFLQAIYPKFDAYLAQWASGPLSCVSVFHNGTEPNLFIVQEKVYSEYFNRFVEASKANGGKPTRFMGLFREINCALSCRTFFGDYISQEAVKRIADDFYLITDALDLVNVPLSIYIPFTKCWRGKRTADTVLAEFTKCAAACKANMALGAQPTCIVDQWVLHMFESKKYNDDIAAGIVGVEKPTNLIREFSDEEIAQTLFTFLFASQDASSSATTWLFQILAQRPDVLDRLREENLAARGGDRFRPFDLDMLESLPYTNAVIKELLRYRPPVIFVPYLATKSFPVTPDYTVPKNALIIPSCYPALHDPVAYPNPDVFDPERWITGDAESKTKNWLVFGAGAHDCLARKYVPLTMAAMIGKAALEIDWVHHATSRSEEIRVFATLFPMIV